MLVRILKISSFLMLLASVVLGQGQDTSKTANQSVVKNDSTATDQARQNKAKLDDTGKTGKDFLDKNANGIDDRLEKKGQKGKQKGRRDLFIDKNGDGIADGRESAIGLRKIQRRKRGKMP